jgi:CRISPR-associated protein Cas1
MMAVLYLTEQGAVLRKDGEALLVEKDGEVLQKIPAAHVEQVVIFGNISLTTPVLHYLLARGIDCVFCSSYGKHHGRLISGEAPLGELRLRQPLLSADGKEAAGIAADVVRGKITNQRALLMRLLRQRTEPQAAVERAIEKLGELLSCLEEVRELDKVRGYEGVASGVYYGALRHLFLHDMGFRGRKKRPPPDPINSILSFGYTLLTYSMQAAVHTVGLDPYIGFLHPPERSRPSLVLDLVEEFRPVIVDAMAVALVNRRQITEEDFFSDPEAPGAVLLSRGGMRKVIEAFEERMGREVLHPVLNRRMTCRSAMEAQARLLVQRIRGLSERYPPFTIR